MNSFLRQTRYIKETAQNLSDAKAKKKQAGLAG